MTGLIGILPFNTEYWHVLSGDDPVLEWVSGTALVPVRETLSPEHDAGFLLAYGARLREAYPRRSDGTTLLPFRRLFLVASR